MTENEKVGVLQSIYSEISQLAEKSARKVYVSITDEEWRTLLRKYKRIPFETIISKLENVKQSYADGITASSRNYVLTAMYDGTFEKIEKLKGYRKTA